MSTLSSAPNPKVVGGNRNQKPSRQIENLPKEIVVEVLSYCNVHDTCSVQGTCKQLREYVQEFLPILHRSYDWTLEHGKLRGLEYLFDMQVPVERITLDSSNLVQQDQQKRIPTGDPLMFLSQYLINDVTQNSTDTDIFSKLNTLIVRGLYSTFDAGLVSLSHFSFPSLRILSKSCSPRIHLPCPISHATSSSVLLTNSRVPDIATNSYCIAAVAAFERRTILQCGYR